MNLVTALAKKYVLSEKEQDYVKLFTTGLKKLVTKTKEVEPKAKAPKGLWGNKNVINTLKKAQKYVESGKITKAVEVICDIPYYIHTIKQGDLVPKATVENKYYGSEDVYIEADALRHYGRMMPDSAPIGHGKLWNNVLLVHKDQK